jgi:hypothetical protein
VAFEETTLQSLKCCFALPNQFSRRNSVVPRRTVHPLPPLEQKNPPEKEKKNIGFY